MRSKRIQPIAKHAEQKQEEAARLFARAQQELVQAEQLLRQLTSYRDDYGQQLVTLAMNAERLRDYQLFIAKLNDAMEQARVDIRNKERVVEQRKLAWLKTRGRSQALNRVVEKYQYEEFLVQEKREQKESDEHGARMQSGKDKTE